MAWNESNYLVNKIDQNPSGPRTAKFLGITNGESDVKAATADMGGQDVRQVLVLEAQPLNKHHRETFKMSELLQRGWIDLCPKECHQFCLRILSWWMIKKQFVHLKYANDHHRGLQTAAARPHPHLHLKSLEN